MLYEAPVQVLCILADGLKCMSGANGAAARVFILLCLPVSARSVQTLKSSEQEERCLNPSIAEVA